MRLGQKKKNVTIWPSIRNSRKDANNEIKKCEVSLDQKSISESDIQDLTDEHISKIDEIYLTKEKEILSV